MRSVIATAFTVLFVFIFLAGSVHAGVKGIRWVDDTVAAAFQQRMDDTAKKFAEEIDRITKKFQSIDEQIARKYLRDIEELVRKYEQDMAEIRIKSPELYGKDRAPIFLLRVVEKFKPYPSENADQKAIMEEEGFKALLNLYASKRGISWGGVRNELKNALFEMFELHKGMDPQKISVFNIKIKEILGYSLLMSIEP